MKRIDRLLQTAKSRNREDFKRCILAIHRGGRWLVWENGQCTELNHEPPHATYIFDRGGL